MHDPENPIPHWTVSTMQGVAAEPTLAGAAIRYANLGIPVFPCVPGGKQPLTPNGFHDATSSARVVHAWWERTPDANIGLPTGARTGVLVVDVDVHAGGSGFEAFERARSERLADRWGWLVRTPSGGVHAYYPTGGDQEQRSWQVPSAHVDFRGDGGYVIAPPSRIEVDGTAKAYDVIAVTTQAAPNGRRDQTAPVPRTTPTDAHPRTTGRAQRPALSPTGARTHRGAHARGRTQPGSLLGVVPDGREPLRPGRHRQLARPGRAARGPGRPRDRDHDQLRSPPRHPARPGEPPGPYPDE